MRRVVAVASTLIPLAYFGSLPPAPAQIGSREEITALFAKHQSRFDKLMVDDQSFDEKADQVVLDTAAKWYVYRMTWSYEAPKEGPKKSETKLQSLAQDFDSRMKSAAYEAGMGKNLKVLAQWSKSLTACFRDVFALKLEDHRLECVNTALMLPALSRLKQEVVGDFLADLIVSEKQHDIVKLCAVKGLREFFPVQPAPPPPAPGDEPDKKLLEKKARDVKRIDAVIQFLASQQKIDKAAGKEALDAVVFLRREAIKTLALAQLPAIEVEKDMKGAASKVTAPIAYHLLRVLAAGGETGANPPFTLGEKCEAVAGIGQLKGRPDEVFRRDVAVYLLANTLVEFLQEYRTDHSQFIAKGEGKRVPLIPWKFHADRLDQALRDLKTNTPTNEANKGVLKSIDLLIDRTKQPLGDVRGYRPIGPPALVQKLVDAFQPKNTSVYHDLKEYQLQIRPSGE
jgi:hypothetical protein